MRRLLIVLTPLLLAGCIKDSASYYIDGANNDHAITLRAEQEYFWKDSITLTLVASNMPDCLRRFDLPKLAASEVSAELFSGADNVYTMRAGGHVIAVDMQNCTALAEPAPEAFGQPVGTYRLEGEQMVFEKSAAPARADEAAEPPA